jgi:diguanylate cyclase (GGDEF)-like protein
MGFGPTQPDRSFRSRRARGRGPWPVRRYLLAIGTISLVALVAGSAYGFAWASQHARSVAVGALSFQADRAAQSLAHAATQGKATIEDVVAQPGLDAALHGPVKGCALTASGGGPFPELRLDIVNAAGQVGCSSGRDPQVFAPNVHAGSSWLRAGLASSSPVVLWGVLDTVTGQRSAVIVAPIPGTGSPAGVVALFARLPPTAAALAHDYAGSSKASFTLVDEASQRVVSTSLTGARATAELGQRFPERRADGEWTGLDGTTRLFSSHAVPGSDWRVYVGVPSSGVFAAARGGLLRAGAVGLVAFLLLGAALLVLNRRVAGPLRAVTGAVVTAGRDPSATRITPTGTAELITLAAEVNAMLDVRAGYEAQLEHQATHDPLTGLPNAVVLRDRLEHALRRDRAGARVAVLSLGIDRFRTLNDALGPDAADRILVELADRLSAALRLGDTLARLGGDQFVVLCEEIDDAEHAARITSRLRSCLDEPFHPSTDPVAVSCSVGISLAAGHDVVPAATQLLREADSAMYEAKTKGDGWALSDQSQQARASEYLETERALRKAVEEAQLRVHYQPLLDIATGRLAGAEALVRWMHPTRGLVPPMEFIPVAEETGQIGAIGAYVLTEACAEAARWATAGHPLTVSVNVAVGQLRDPAFVASVQRALGAAGLPPSQLCLEVTESAMMRATGAETNALEELRRLGVRLAIDDFGTGYSSLSYLHQLPVDELKIDRSFINRIAAGNRDAHLVEAIMGMAHALDLAVVAEGVETAEQLEFLAELGCQQAQGYLFSPAVPAEVLRQRLTTGRSGQAEAASSHGSAGGA